jgi:pescadillo protein
MGRIQKKGVKGAAANFITRQQALKKLQISIADFR